MLFIIRQQVFSNARSARTVARFLSCSQCLLRLRPYPAPVEDCTPQVAGSGLIKITPRRLGPQMKRHFLRMPEPSGRRRKLRSFIIPTRKSKLLLCKLLFLFILSENTLHQHLHYVTYYYAITTCEFVTAFSVSMFFFVV